MFTQVASHIALALVLSVASGCGAQEAERAPRSVAAVDTTIGIAFDYAGAEALLAAMERDSLTTADVDSLLRIHGVRAMVDNVTRFIPDVGETHFRGAVQSFARTKEPPEDEKQQYFQLYGAWRNRDNVRALVGRLREKEATILRRTSADLAPWQPRTGPLRMTAYFVVGGVSTGFVPDAPGNTSIYANLAREKREEPVIDNVTHEAYHVMQKAAQRRTPGLARVADSIESIALPERLLATTLAEGTAKYVVEPDARYWRNTSGRVRENFAVFDTVLAQLRQGTTDWQRAYERGFTSAERDRFYFVGYEMTKAIAKHCGESCVGRLFEQPPVEFFRQYVRLYREHPEIVGRFSNETEAFIESQAR